MDVRMSGGAVRCGAVRCGAVRWWVCAWRSCVRRGGRSRGTCRGGGGRRARGAAAQTPGTGAPRAQTSPAAVPAPTQETPPRRRRGHGATHRQVGSCRRGPRCERVEALRCAPTRVRGCRTIDSGEARGCRTCLSEPNARRPRPDRCAAAWGASERPRRCGGQRIAHAAASSTRRGPR